MSFGKTYSELGDSDDEDLFRKEDSGPPELSEEQLQELDREAMVTEINRTGENRRERETRY